MTVSGRPQPTTTERRREQEIGCSRTIYPNVLPLTREATYLPAGRVSLGSARSVPRNRRRAR
jgi:hypothetical protein